MSSVMELMKSVAIQQMQNDAQNNGSGLANQFMNQLSQQQAQKAREQEMMQKFLMQRQMKKEDFERQVEFGKMFKKQQNQEKPGMSLAEQEKMQDKFMKAEKENLRKMKNGIDLMRNVVDLTEDPRVVRALEKIKKIPGLKTALDAKIKALVHGINSKADKNQLDALVNDIGQIIASKAKGIGSVDWTPEDTLAFSLLVNAIKGGTIGYIDAVGGNQSKSTIDTLLNAKALSIIEGPQAAHNFYNHLYKNEAKHVEHVYEGVKKQFTKTYGDAFTEYVEDSGLDEKYRFDEKYENPRIVGMEEFGKKIFDKATQHGLSKSNVQEIIQQVGDESMTTQELYNEVEKKIPEYAQEMNESLNTDDHIQQLLKNAMNNGK